MARRPLSRGWAAGFFKPEIFSPGSAQAEAAAPREARFVWRALGLARGERVLDAACGTGRHARRLARMGAEVVGVDLSADYLREARRLARGLDRARFQRADLRRLPFDGEFDAAINLWTSFGYGADAREDLEVLRGIARALRPGGRFLIDLIDFAAISRRPPADSWMERADGSFLLESARIVRGRDPRIVSRWIVLRPGRAPRRARSVVRGYDRARLFAALKEAGFRPSRAWAGLDGYGSRKRSGNRLVVLAVKPGLGGAASR